MELLTMVPMWVLSWACSFHPSAFPDDLVQPAIKAATPLTAVIDALRANMLQGAGFAQ